MDFHHVPSCGGYAMLIDAMTRLYAFEWLDIWRRNRVPQHCTTHHGHFTEPFIHGVAYHLCHQNVGKLPICHLGRWSFRDFINRFGAEIFPLKLPVIDEFPRDFPVFFSMIFHDGNPTVSVSQGPKGFHHNLWHSHWPF